MDWKRRLESSAEPVHKDLRLHLPVKAALGKTALGLRRWTGHTNMAAAWRRLVAQPAQALALIGMVWENSMILLTAAIRRYSLLLWRETEKF